jgi:hypothetical protein
MLHIKTKDITRTVTFEIEISSLALVQSAYFPRQDIPLLSGDS